MFGLYKKKLGTKYNRREIRKQGNKVRLLILENVFVKFIKQLINRTTYITSFSFATSG